MFSFARVDGRHILQSITPHITPTRLQAEKLLRDVEAEAGRNGAATLLSVPCWLVDRWLHRGGKPLAMLQRDRRLIWLVHCLLFNPGRLASPFHVATFGRFLPPTPQRVVSCGVEPGRAEGNKPQADASACKSKEAK